MMIHPPVLSVAHYPAMSVRQPRVLEVPATRHVPVAMQAMSGGSVESATSHSDAPTSLHDIETVKILIAEDDSNTRWALVESLLDYLDVDRENLLEASSLSSALAVFRENSRAVRAVLTDVEMPEPGAGFQLHDTLRYDYAFDGPIAIISARPSYDPDLSRILSENTQTRFFPKPLVGLEDLMEWLRSYL